MGSSAIEYWTKIYLHGVDMKGMKIQKLIRTAHFYMIQYA